MPDTIGKIKVLLDKALESTLFPSHHYGTLSIVLAAASVGYSED